MEAGLAAVISCAQLFDRDAGSLAEPELSLGGLLKKMMCVNRPFNCGVLSSCHSLSPAARWYDRPVGAGRVAKAE
jgi:hypothetical protein